MDKIHLKTRFIILFTALMVISLPLYIFWSNYSQQKQAIGEMQEKAYVLSQQMEAVWEFMTIHQDRINYDADGTYNFKGLHCSLVGKSIGKLFGIKTDYVTRYVNFNPRNPDDTPDEFESEALRRFMKDKTLKQIHTIAEYEGEKVFRYAKPMYLAASCLECHGEPKGELDVVGFPKEGWKEGDLAGILSIIMPTDIYMANMAVNIKQEVTFFAILMLVTILISYYATAKLVTKPLFKLKEVTEQVRMGNMDIDVEAKEIDAQGEIKDLAIHLGGMIKELRNVYNNLENEVKLRTTDLTHANEILAKQQKQLEDINNGLMEDNQYKSDFMAIMSHELRTPLTSIISCAEVMSRVVQGRTEKEHKIVDEILSNSRILLNLINNILDMARIEAGKTEMIKEPVDIVDVVNVVKSVIMPLIQKKNLKFTASIDRNVPIIEADEEKLKRVLENLLSNAVKFTRAEGEIFVNVGYNEQSSELTIEVKDTGIGIKEDELKQIFEKFVQGDSSIHRPYSGSGLGLALVRELVELHGGKVTVESEFGTGSVFTVILPVRALKGGENEGLNER